jgi:signal recognition particle receptor subunit beta
VTSASPEESGVVARIVYWGVEGSGKSTNLTAIHARLRPDHRGEMRNVPTRLDPTVTFEMLPIELGELGGVRTRIQIVAVPGALEHGPTRKQLLDEVDGIVLVIDSQGDRLQANVECFDELRTSLAAYGRSLDEIPLVVQYNKRDLADAYATEDLYRKFELTGVPVFQAVATEGTGVLETLSTISKRVIAQLRDQARPKPAPQPAVAPEPEPAPQPVVAPEPEPAPQAQPAPEPPPPPPTQPPMPTPTERMEAAILEEEGYDAGLDTDPLVHTVPLLETQPEEPAGGVHLGSHISIVSVGEASRAGDRSVRVPVVLGDAEGNTSTVQLTIQLEPLLEEPS